MAQSPLAFAPPGDMGAGWAFVKRVSVLKIKRESGYLRSGAGRGQHVFGAALAVAIKRAAAIRGAHIGTDK